MSIVRVAEAANVSYATAWRIINNQPGGSEEAVTAVREAMEQVGYAPGKARKRGRRPRMMDGIRTRNIALLHLRRATLISTSVLNCVQGMLAAQRLNLIFAHCSTPEELPPAVRAGNVDGILGYGQFPEDAVDANLKKIPAVWMMSRSDSNDDPWGDRVKPDNDAIGKLAAGYLLQRGHKRLAYMNPEIGFEIYQARLASFQAATRSAGVEAQIFSSSSTDDLNLEAEHCVEQWMSASPRPHGIFVPVDRVTLFIYRHLERRGIVPGRDVDIVSCDNEQELLSLLRPPPPSIDINREMIARLAVERLLWRMKNGASSPAVTTTVSPTLAVATSYPSNGNGNGNGNGHGNGHSNGNGNGKRHERGTE